MSDKLVTRKSLQQRNILLAEHEDDDGGDDGSGSGSILPGEEYYELFEEIREKHKGRVEDAKGFNKNKQNNMQTTEFNNDSHPLSSMAYFSGFDDLDTIPIAELSENQEIKNALELRKNLEMKKRLGLSPSPTTTPTFRPG